MTRHTWIPSLALVAGCASSSLPPPPPAPPLSLTPVVAPSATPQTPATPHAPQPAPAPGSAKPPRPTTLDPAAIDAWVAAQVKAQELVGASLVVVKDGQTILAKGYGTTAVDGGSPVTPDTAFGIGSVTKQFACAAAIALEDDKKLSMSDRVARWYPKATRAADITLDDLGAHLAGYPDYYPLDFVDRRMRDAIAPDDLLARYAGGALDFEPRRRWSYSNTGFVMLGRVVERVSGKPFGELLRARFFGPLGMKSSSLGPGAAPHATGHTSFALGAPERATLEGDGWLHAAGGVWSSAQDLARWDLALADGKVLSPAGAAKLATARRTSDGRSTDYGCGIGVRHAGGETILQHGGAVSGFLAFNAVVPRTRSAVILLVNSDHGSPGDIHQTILGLLLAQSRNAPKVAGVSARDAALDLFRQMQKGEIDRTRVGAELSAYLSPERLREAAPRLAALGEPKSVIADPPGERGGLEVSSVKLSTFTKER